MLWVRLQKEREDRMGNNSGDEVWLLYENVLLFLLPHLPRFV